MWCLLCFLIFRHFNWVFHRLNDGEVGPLSPWIFSVYISGTFRENELGNKIWTSVLTPSFWTLYTWPQIRYPNNPKTPSNSNYHPNPLIHSRDITIFIFHGAQFCVVFEETRHEFEKITKIQTKFIKNFDPTHRTSLHENICRWFSLPQSSGIHWKLSFSFSYNNFSSSLKKQSRGKSKEDGFILTIAPETILWTRNKLCWYSLQSCVRLWKKHYSSGRGLRAAATPWSLQQLFILKWFCPTTCIRWPLITSCTSNNENFMPCEEWTKLKVTNVGVIRVRRNVQTFYSNLTEVRSTFISVPDKPSLKTALAQATTFPKA